MRITPSASEVRRLLPVGVLLLFVAFWVFAAIRFEGPGLKHLGHYAAGNLPLTGDTELQLGETVEADIVLAGAGLSSDVARLARRGDTFQLTAGTPGGAVAAAASRDEAAGEEFGLDTGEFVVERGSTRIEVGLTPVARLESYGGTGRRTAVLVPLRVGYTSKGSGVQIRVCGEGQIVVGDEPLGECRPGTESMLTPGESVQVGGPGPRSQVVEWMRPQGAGWGIFSRRSELAAGEGLPVSVAVRRGATRDPDALLWPGQSMELPSVAATIVWRRTRFETKPRLVTTSTRDTALAVRRMGLAKATVSLRPVAVRQGEPLGLGRNRYVLRLFEVESPPTWRKWFVALYASQRPPTSAFATPLLTSATDPVLYSPLDVIGLSGGRCAALWFRTANGDQVLSPTAGTGSRPVDAGTRSNTRFVPPAWLSPGRRSEALVVCASFFGSYELKGISDTGAVVPPQLDLVFKGTNELPERQAPGSSNQPSLKLNARDVIYVGGQIFELMPPIRPDIVLVTQVTIPLSLLLAALPLGLFLHRQATASVARLGAAAPWMTRFVVQAPFLALLAIIMAMWAGGWYQLLLASTSSLASSPGFLHAFLLSSILAIAVAAGLVAWVWPPSAFRRIRSARLLFACLALGTGAACWLDAILARLVGPSVRHPWIPFGERPWWIVVLPAWFAMAWLVCVVGERRRWASPGLGRVTTAQLNRLWPKLPAPVRLFVTKSRMFRVLRASLWAVALNPEPLVACYNDLVSAREEQTEILLGQGRRRAAFASGLQAMAWHALVWGSAIALGLMLLWVTLFISSKANELWPPVFVLSCVWLLGGLASPVRRNLEEGPERPWGPVVLSAVTVTLLPLGVVLVAIVPMLREPAAILIAAGGIAACFFTILLSHSGFTAGFVLRATLPFFVGLAAAAWLCGDFGSLLLWLPLLSALCSAALLMYSLTSRATSGWKSSLGHLLACVVLLLTPFVLFWAVDAAGIVGGETPAMGRSWTRFRLVEAPTYYEDGGWLAQVRWLSAGSWGPRWIPNLNSDVALAGLRHLYGSGSLVYVSCLVALGILVLGAFLESYTRAATESDDRASTSHLGAALLAFVALMAVLSIWFVHVSGSMVDRIPLTGVPMPWLSHSAMTHIIFTSLVLGACARCARMADSEEFRG